MADIWKVINGLKHCTTSLGCFECPYSELDERSIECQLELDRDALELLKEQQAEIDRLKAEKNRVIEQIENEINILHKESRNVKDEVGTATYEWLINGFQASLDMIKDGEQE